MQASTIHLDKKKEGLLALTVAALGVVYGDIATSPLYAIYDIFFGHGEVSRTPGHVIGAISLAVWALILIISCKYILFVLQADNDGQGGSMPFTESFIGSESDVEVSSSDSSCSLPVCFSGME